MLSVYLQKEYKSTFVKLMTTLSVDKKFRREFCFFLSTFHMHSKMFKIKIV